MTSASAIPPVRPDIPPPEPELTVREMLDRAGGTSSGSMPDPLGRYFRGLAVLRTDIGFQYDLRCRKPRLGEGDRHIFAPQTTQK
jgi:hypothetical protein